MLIFTLYIYTGTLPAIFIIEAIMQSVAEALGVPPEVVKEKNLYEKGQVKRKGVFGLIHVRSLQLIF